MPLLLRPSPVAGRALAWPSSSRDTMAASRSLPAPLAAVRHLFRDYSTGPHDGHGSLHGHHGSHHLNQHQHRRHPNNRKAPELSSDWPSLYLAGKLALWSGLCYYPYDTLPRTLQEEGLKLVAYGRTSFTCWYVADGYVDFEALPRRAFPRRPTQPPPQQQLQAQQQPAPQTDGRDADDEAISTTPTSTTTTTTTSGSSSAACGSTHRNPGRPQPGWPQGSESHLHDEWEGDASAGVGAGDSAAHSMRSADCAPKPPQHYNASGAGQAEHRHQLQQHHRHNHVDSGHSHLTTGSHGVGLSDGMSRNGSGKADRNGNGDGNSLINGHGYTYTHTHGHGHAAGQQRSGGGGGGHVLRDGHIHIHIHQHHQQLQLPAHHPHPHRKAALEGSAAPAGVGAPHSGGGGSGGGSAVGPAAASPPQRGPTAAVTPGTRCRFIFLRGVQWAAPDVNTLSLSASLASFWPSPLRPADSTVPADGAAAAAAGSTAASGAATAASASSSEHLVAHSGVAAMARELLPSLLPHIRRAAAEGVDHLVFAGHSLGGSLAKLLWAMSIQAGHRSPDATSCHTFGSPPVLAHASGGGGARVLRLLRAPPAAAVNWVLEHDPVPRAMLTADPYFAAARRAVPGLGALLALRGAVLGEGAALSSGRFLYETVGEVLLLRWSARGGCEAVPVSEAEAESQLQMALDEAVTTPVRSLQYWLDHHHASYHHDLETAALVALRRQARSSQQRAETERQQQQQHGTARGPAAAAAAAATGPAC